MERKGEKVKSKKVERVLEKRGRTQMKSDTGGVGKGKGWRTGKADRRRV